MAPLYNRIPGRNLERLGALCVINTWVSIVAIALVQLTYAIAPRLWRHS